MRVRAEGQGFWRLAMSACAALAFATSVLAEEPAPGKPVLSPGWTFAEQGGATIYANVCAACHQPDATGATGAAAYPALAKDSELASTDDVVRILLKGQGAMPPVGAMMSDEQVADVINYVRTHLGNAYTEPVSAAEVKAVRPPSP